MWESLSSWGIPRSHKQKKDRMGQAGDTSGCEEPKVQTKLLVAPSTKSFVPAWLMSASR
jgi:hypothetical protein